MAKRRRKRKSRLFLTILAILLIVAVTAIYQSSIFKKQIYPDKYSDIVKKYAERYEVEPSLVLAVIKAESGFDETAKSHKNAYGLMQVTEDTMTWLKTKIKDPIVNDSRVNDLYDPEVCILFGTFFLKVNLEKYGDLKTALCAYNAGNARTDQWLTDSRYSADGKKIDTAAFTETEQYTKKVIKYKEEYDKLYFS